MTQLNKWPSWLLILSPGILFWLAWPPISVFIFLFIAFVPLFEIDRRIPLNKKRKFFFTVYLSLFIWNALTTWWVWNSSSWGALVMLIFNALFMTIPWVLMRFSRRFVSIKQSQILFIIFWLLFEYLHQRWDLSWPWLTLGNAFSGVPWYVQWYEFTGTTGGSFIILLVNLWLFTAWSEAKKKPFWFSVSTVVFAGILSISLNWFAEVSITTPSKDKYEVVILQPSFDPWNEKFVRDPGDMVQEMLNICSTQLDSNTRLLVWPETSLVDNIELSQAAGDYQVRMIQELRNRYPKLEVLTGANMQQIYRNCKKRPTSTARPTGNPAIWWDSYNSALFLDKTGANAFYHKSKLVPGTEQMPLTNWFPSINDLAVQLDENSMTGSLGTSDSVVLFGQNNIIPAICYESIYGDYLAKFARKGGSLIAVITNDAWWGNTPGYRQHLALSQLRAIEQRKWVVRSANTGTSAFIDPSGNLHQATKWFEKKAIKMKVDLQHKNTLYTKLGDLPILLIVIVILAFIFKFNR